MTHQVTTITLSPVTVPPNFIDGISPKINATLLSTIVQRRTRCSAKILNAANCASAALVGGSIDRLDPRASDDVSLSPMMCPYPGGSWAVVTMKVGGLAYPLCTCGVKSAPSVLEEAQGTSGPAKRQGCGQQMSTGSVNRRALRAAPATSISVRTTNAGHLGNAPSSRLPQRVGRESPGEQREAPRWGRGQAGGEGLAKNRYELHGNQTTSSPRQWPVGGDGLSEHGRRPWVPRAVTRSSFQRQTHFVGLSQR